MDRARRLAAAGIAICSLSGLAGLWGARVNTTGSFPQGLYWMTGEAMQKGALVIACPPDVEAVAEGLRRGYLGTGACPGGYGLVIKKLVGLPGDRVAVTGQGVSVNGAAVPNSAPRQADAQGRPLPVHEAVYTLGAGQVLLMSDHSPTSFDGRYFGPVDQIGIQGVLRSVFTLGPSTQDPG